MTKAQVVAIVAKVKEKADQSVDYTPRYGAVCPECGRARMQTVGAKPWKDGMKVRYHKCGNITGRCLLAVMQTTIKSVQVENK
ncbi:hypothetical protein [uncultured Desulfobacter sp.]|uniref:hypothetical protein n=1 Tax=uncultured Desulfobacter sp. TaxID=240139 RepID=UPI0029F5A13C|nr:hypothetical protein [uncultured Desulfobacter sp.]